MKLLILVAFLLCFLAESSLASVLAIDYGSDWIKAALMKPGVPFDVLLNKDSKRKIQSVVGWKKGDRLFGGDAVNVAARFPSDSFSSLKYLVAAPANSQSVSYYTEISTAEVIATSRRTAGVRRSDGSEWSTEELIAMQFAYVKELAEQFAGEKVYDVIVTVPPFYTQFERDAVADAIEIAGLRTLALINDGTAVAVNYAMTRNFPTPEHHIIYDAGASSIRATVVSFASTTGTQISVAGVGYDRQTGGTELDRRLRNILIEDFNAKHKRDVRTDKRGMTKLWKEAGRVKAILSANTDAVSTVESVAWDIDFKTKVSRAKFENACSDLKGRFSQPIADALAHAGLTLNDITSVILTGGSSRTPMIQSAVRSYVGNDKIALNVNADEAAVLGAALHGAGLSRQFKTKDIKVSDITLHDIQATYFAQAASSQAKARSISSVVFPSGSKVGTKKTMTFKRKDDFTLWLDYAKPPASGFSRSILEIEITGVSEALANLTERGAVDPVVKATVSLSDSGFLSVQDVVAFGEIKDESIAGKLKGLFGGGSTFEEETLNAETTSTASTTESSSAASASPSATAGAKALTKESNTIALTVITKFGEIPPMTVLEKREARDRLRAVDFEESAKRRREEARNTLEGYLYRVRDLIDDSNSDTPFQKCSQEAERRALAEKVADSIAWLHERGDLAETSQFLDKRVAVEVLEQPIVHRYKEISEFPQALNNSQMWNWSTRLFLTEAKANLTAEQEAGLPSKWTKIELDALEKTLKDHESWLNEWVEKQKSVKMNEDPVISTTEMKARAKTLETHLMKLMRRKVPKKTTTSSTATATATESDTPSEAETTEATSPPGDIHDEL
ncbi:hypothetical protein PLICRDRAFT_174899 [Plicaturopsis crispa FD-325 SS-3]|nr:hypothetical protein PLICRDRAFT_174899 [Plicaturopsis crispa FD-325 SS-3]